VFNFFVYKEIYYSVWDELQGYKNAQGLKMTIDEKNIWIL